MPNLYNLSQEELADLLARWDEPRFRAKQLREWLYERRAASFDAMTSLPKSLRHRLAAETTLGQLELVGEQASKEDGQTVIASRRTAYRVRAHALRR
jgi:23S rRNA (adenine2503-C2)-methyltransferase